MLVETSQTAVYRRRGTEHYILTQIVPSLLTKCTCSAGYARLDSYSIANLKSERYGKNDEESKHMLHMC